MPKRRTPQTLRVICLWEIIQNLEKYSTKELQNLPTDLSGELIDLYNEEFWPCNGKEAVEYYNNRNRLIQANMKKLHLHQPNGCKETLMMVLDTCKNLTHFACKFYVEPRFNLLQLVISLPNIVELKLSINDEKNDYANKADDILEAIGNNCFQLEILHFLFARTTDDGVRRLCQSNSTGAKIKELNFGYCNVGVNGCLTALQNLKQLKKLYCFKQFVDAVEMAFKKLFENSKDSQIPTFQLCELPKTLNIDNFAPGFLSFVTACCPNLRELNLEAQKNFDCHIEDLKRGNENICLKLTIWHADNIMADFSFLGCRVVELSLLECEVHLPTIGFTCPNLTDLSLHRVYYMPINYVARNNSVVPFCKLLLLELTSYFSVPIPIAQLQFLLENCLDLRVLRIMNNNEFIDDVMFKVLHVFNPLRHLTDFELRGCDVVSSIAILHLLEAENELTRLTIHGCKKIQKNELLQIESVINENNFCVTLEKDEESDEETGEEENDEESDWETVDEATAEESDWETVDEATAEEYDDENGEESDEESDDGLTNDKSD